MMFPFLCLPDPQQKLYRRCLRQVKSIKRTLMSAAGDAKQTLKVTSKKTQSVQFSVIAFFYMT